MADLDVVHEDEQVLAHRRTRPFWPTHVVVVPERHSSSLTTVTEADEADVLGQVPASRARVFGPASSATRSSGRRLLLRRLLPGASPDVGGEGVAAEREGALVGHDEDIAVG